jgi:glycosyltransferase involved in cell wall biosynthesis
MRNCPPTLIQPRPLVSVIIPCYNCAAFLQDAVSSALDQSYTEVEVVVVDDGSTDCSPEIAQRFPVRYMRQQNAGLSVARNVGIRQSKGSYLVFLDADDRLKPEAIDVGLHVLAQRPDCAMSVGDHCFISEDGSFKANSRKVCLSAFHYEALLESNFIEMISTVLFRRSVLIEVGGFDTGLRGAEDYDLYLRIARSYPICSHPAVVAEYRKHESNLSHNSELMLTMTLRVLRREAQFIQTDPTRLRAFRRGLRTWQKHYGRQLAVELAHSLTTLGIDDTVRKLLSLVREYPQGLPAVMLLWMLEYLPQTCGRGDLRAAH